MSQNSPITLALYYQVGFLRSSRQAKMLGGDVILYAATKRVLRDSEGEGATLDFFFSIRPPPAPGLLPVLGPTRST